MKKLLATSFAIALVNIWSSSAALAAIPPIPPPAPYQVQFAVKNYGAQCNGQTVTNLTTTAGSPTVTGVGFTAADVGKTISIWAGTATTFTAATAINSQLLTFTGSVGSFSNGMMVRATNVPTGDYITGSVSSTQFTLNTNATAGGSGISASAYPVINTTIIAASAGSITLNTNALASISGVAVATYGTDDTTAIQAAENAAHAIGGGQVNFPLGMCIVSAPITTDGNIGFNGLGPGKSIIKWISGTAQTGAVFTNNFTFTGSNCNLTVGQQYHDTSFTNFEIDELSATVVTYTAAPKGIDFKCSVRSYIANMYVHDVPATCIATDFGMPTTIVNNVATNCGRLVSASGAGGNGIGEGVAGLVNESYVLEGNTVINPAHYGVYVESQVTNASVFAPAVINGNIVIQGGAGQSSVDLTAGIANSGAIGTTIVGNYIYGGSLTSTNGWVGIYEDAGTLSTSSGAQSTISSNTLIGGGLGIGVYYNAKGPSVKSKTIVSDNNVVGTGNNSQSAACYLIATGSTGTTNATNIEFSGNMGSACASAGLLVSGSATVSNLSIVNNQFFDNGSLASTTDYRKAGIAINSNVAGLVMTGNSLYDDGAATQKYGLSVNTGFAVTGATVVGNNFATNTTSPFDMLGTLTGKLEANNGMPVPTVSGASTPAGTGEAGTYTASGTGTSTVTITPYATANILAPHGYVCGANDLTVPANFQVQSASSTTTATITGTTVTADVVNFQCKGW